VKTLKTGVPARFSTQPDQTVAVLLETYAANDRMNQLLLENLDARAWRAKPSQGKRSDTRTIGAMFAHMHNSRLIWLKWSAPHLKCPAALDPLRCTIKQTAAAHKKSTKQCLIMLEEGLSDDPNRQVKVFSRGNWAPDWPAGPTMFAYMFAHDAHHRGQIIALARRLGHRLPDNASYGIWHWDKIWKELGFAEGPR
jgi:uncharacterized damage-inducible protein DinB